MTEASAEVIAALVQLGAEGEQRLLRRERRAERELNEARAQVAAEDERLARARRRADRARAKLTAAEARLQQRQHERVAGPFVDNPPDPALAPESP